jgi:AcrR family transcriptional regulator
MPPVAAPLPLRERNKVRVRADLLDAVLRSFMPGEPAALSLEAVAQRAGCSRATVYSYFPGGLNDMLCAVYAQISDEVIHEAEQLHAGAQGPHARIIGLAHALLSIAQQPQRGPFFAQLEPSLIPALQPVLGRASQRFEELVAADLQGRIDAAPRVVAALLVGAMREASVRVARDPAQRDVFIAGLAVLLDRLLGKAPPARKGKLRP